MTYKCIPSLKDILIYLIFLTNLLISICKQSVYLPLNQFPILKRILENGKNRAFKKNVLSLNLKNKKRILKHFQTQMRIYRKRLEIQFFNLQV